MVAGHALWKGCVGEEPCPRGNLVSPLYGVFADGILSQAGPTA